MANINTEWDYEIKKEVFRVTADKGYVHKTFTTLETTSTDNNVSLMAYFTAQLKVNVDKDIGNSYVVIYDNGEPIPFTISGTEYTQYEWNENTTAKTFTIKLGYITEHNIQARYYGNQDGLPSKSNIIVLQEDTPDLFSTTLSRNSDTTVQYNSSSISLPLMFTSGQEAQETLNKPIKIYVDNVLKKTQNISLTQNNTTGTATASLTGVKNGKHTIECVFEGDDYNESAKLTFEIMVGYDLRLFEYPQNTVYKIYETGETHLYDSYNTITGLLLDWNGQPLDDETITCTNNGSSSTAQTNSEGKVSFIQNTCITNFKLTYDGTSTSTLTLPCAKIKKIEVSTDYDFVIEDTQNNLTVEVTDYEWVNNGAVEVTNGIATLEGIPVFINDSEGNDFVATLNKRGVATLNISAPAVEIPPNDITNIEDTVIENPNTVEYTAIAGSVGATQEIEHLWEYLSVSESEINKSYEILGGMGNVMRLAKGYKFKATKDPKAKQYGCRVGFGDGSTDIGDYQIIFKNLDSVKNVFCKIGGWRNQNGKVTYNRPTFTDKQYQIYFAPNATYILSRVGNHMNITREGVGTLITSEITTLGEPMIEFIFENETDGLILNNIKIKEL